MGTKKQLIALLLFGICVSRSWAQAPLQVLTSIKPLQLLALEVGGDAVTVDALLDPRGSPHDYQLRPSDRTKLDNAEVVFWIGPRLEHFLQPALKVVPKHVAQVALDDAGVDSHIWVDPIAMQAVAQRMAAAYASLRPAQAHYFSANADRVTSKLASADQRLRQLLSHQQRPYIVEHDAYARFESRYGLSHLAALTDSSELPPSVAEMLKIRGLLDDGKVGCIWGEAQESTQLRALIDGKSVRVIRLDPMAAKITVREDGLLDFYRQLGDAIAGCIKA